MQISSMSSVVVVDAGVKVLGFSNTTARPRCVSSAGVAAPA